MAQYYTDFSEYSTGLFPSDWTESQLHSPVVEVRADASSPGGKLLAINPEGGTSNSTYLTWDVANGTADAEIVARFYLGSSDFMSSAQLKARMALDGTDTGYGLRQNETFSNDTELFKKDGTSFTSLTTTSQNTISSTQDFWLRLRVNGTTISGRVWQHGDPEPAGFQITSTDSTHSSGAVGFDISTADGFEIHEVGVGTAGDSAPKAPVALPGPNAPTGLTLTEL